MNRDLAAQHFAGAGKMVELGLWERVHNPAFNYGEFATIRNQAGLNSIAIVQIRSLLDSTAVKRLAQGKK